MGRLEVLMAVIAKRLLKEAEGIVYIEGEDLQVGGPVIGAEGKGEAFISPGGFGRFRGWWKIKVSTPATLEGGYAQEVKDIRQGGYTLARFDREAGTIVVVEDWGSTDYWDRWEVKEEGGEWKVRYTGTVGERRYWPIFLADALDIVRPSLD